MSFNINIVVGILIGLVTSVIGIWLIPAIIYQIKYRKYYKMLKRVKPNPSKEEIDHLVRNAERYKKPHKS